MEKKSRIIALITLVAAAPACAYDIPKTEITFTIKNSSPEPAYFSTVQGVRPGSTKTIAFPDSLQPGKSKEYKLPLATTSTLYFTGQDKPKLSIQQLEQLDGKTLEIVRPRIVPELYRAIINQTSSATKPAR